MGCVGTHRVRKRNVCRLRIRLRGPFFHAYARQPRVHARIGYFLLPFSPLRVAVFFILVMHVRISLSPGICDVHPTKTVAHPSYVRSRSICIVMRVGAARHQAAGERVAVIELDRMDGMGSWYMVGIGCAARRARSFFLLSHAWLMRCCLSARFDRRSRSDGRHAWTNGGIST